MAVLLPWGTKDTVFRAPHREAPHFGATIMPMAAIEYAYSYAFPSELTGAGGLRHLHLATSGGTEAHPYFFEGRLAQPRRTADLLLAVSLVSRTRFFVPGAMLRRILQAADPVVTAGGERLRFEAFSVCAGVYARLDLLPEAIEGSWASSGTTNVDFGPAMRAALETLLVSERVGLSVGAEGVALHRAASVMVERKVRLPVRWLKGFVEVQAYQARLQPVLETPGTEARRFLSSLPSTITTGGPSYLLSSGSALRLSQRAASGAVAVGGPERLRALAEAARHAKVMRVYGGHDGVSAFELVFDDARLHVVLSPEPARGFSGEGQVLSNLARTDARGPVGRVRAALRWQRRLVPQEVASQTGASLEEVTGALAVLGARGLVGFDLTEGAYFHRELPFDLERVEELQPRLRDARALVAEGAVRLVDQTEARVQGSAAEHRVRLSEDGDRCTCPWFAKHAGARGPCKHVLAAWLVRDAEG
jgi:hypothetical protein